MAKKGSKGSSLVGKLFKRGIKFGVSVAVLSVFVLGIAYTVREVSSASPSKLISLLSPEVGQVAGDLIKRATDFGIASPSNSIDSGEVSSSSATTGGPVMTLAILADSHVGNDKNEYIENKTHLARAVEKAKSLGADEIVHVGDVTNFGVLEDLRDAKEILDDSGIPYVAIPGDRDIAQTSNADNFVSVFGTDNHFFILAGHKFVAFNNSANYTLISQDKMTWFKNELDGADFVILSQPLYTEGVLVNCQYMGNSCEDQEDSDLKQKQLEVKKQRDELLSLIRASDVKAVIAGDHHMSSQTQDKDKPGLMHYVVGAVGNTFKEGYSQSSWQNQSFSLIKLYEGEAFTVEDVIL